MIQSVTITNYLGSLNDNLAKQTNQSTVHITLKDDEPSHGMLIMSITGLGPVKATINRTELATTDGSLYNSAKLEERNIVIKIKFLEAKSIEDVRLLTYKYFPIKRKVIFSIKTDNRDARAIGYIESNEPDIFSKDECADISIICPDPYFYSNLAGDSPHIIQFSGLEDEFEFPFDNNSLTENLIELGNIQPIVTKDFLYQGDQEIGVTMNIDFMNNVDTDFTVYHYKSSFNPNEPELMSGFLIKAEKLHALMGTFFLSGDRVTVETTQGNEHIFLIRNGVSHNILNAVTRDSDWFKLAKGSNRFIFTAYGNESKLNFRIENYVIYEGV